MPAAIRITRHDHTAEHLRLSASRCRNSAASRRMLALALILDGQSRAAAAQAAGMDRQTLRDWVHRYNERGLDGLANTWGGGRKALLDARQAERLAELVRQGPDPAEHGVVRWRRIDLARVLQAEFGVSVAERTVGSLLRRLGFRRISARPQHPKQNLAAHARAQPVEVWFQDEARIGQQGSLTYVWAEQGSRPPRPPDTRYEWTYLFGAICPARGCGAGLVLPHADTAAMNLHLAEISRTVTAGSHAVLVLDGAGWHKLGGALRVPDNISLLTLPPYSPELNPVENVWQFLRQNHLSNRVFATYDAIVDACCQAWNALIAQPARIQSITNRHWM